MRAAGSDSRWPSRSGSYVAGYLCTPSPAAGADKTAAHTIVLGAQQEEPAESVAGSCFRAVIQSSCKRLRWQGLAIKQFPRATVQEQSSPRASRGLVLSATNAHFPLGRQIKSPVDSSTLRTEGEPLIPAWRRERRRALRHSSAVPSNRTPVPGTGCGLASNSRTSGPAPHAPRERTGARAARN